MNLYMHLQILPHISEALKFKLIFHFQKTELSAQKTDDNIKKK
jgi:hypothetical protein